MDISVRGTQVRRIAQKIYAHLNTAFSGIADNRVALAVSGGLDSRALLEAVARWPSRQNFDFLVLTVNHQTRTESVLEARAVAARAISLGFEARVLTLYCGDKRDEGTLRNLRYEALGREISRQKIRVLCTAHQKDDDAEGLFMDIFGFGGGKSGAGMMPVREAEFGQIIRPFLPVERRELLLYLTSIGVTDYFNDPSNCDGTSARQKARDFLNIEATRYHANPIGRFAKVASMHLEERAIIDSHLRDEMDQIKIFPAMPAARLRSWLKKRYAQLCPEHDPRDAAIAIDSILKKARGTRLIGVSGVDQGANWITLGRLVEWKFDLPGAKALMTPELVTLFRN